MSLIDRIESLERLYEKVRVERDALAAHAEAFQARAIALAADRDQISLTLAVAKADRDKWFNRARDLEAAFRHVISIVDDVVMHDHEKVRQLQRHCSVPETPVSTLCAVCDQIKELHPNTHPWVPKTTTKTLVKPEFDPAWVCGVCGKRHGPDQCLGAETGTKLVWLSSGGNFLENEFYYNCSVCGETDKPCKHHPETRAKQFTVPALPEGDQICIHCGKGIGYHYQTAAGDLFCEVPKETEGEQR